MREAVTVSQLNRYIHDMFSTDKVLNSVIVKGEVSNFKESRGNYYFSLKDENSSIQCIIFANYGRQNVDLSSVSDGIKITVYGKAAIYEKGMFDESYKKDIPKYAINIGVVTAEHGAAIRDIFKTIKDKNPYANVILYPAVVQGDEAYKTIVEGIMELDKMNLDVIIIGRGGGSIEDLYCFNDERVAYAIFNASTPIISAVGHEINDSISDLVADVRVATPTAAGEMATFSYSDFEEDLDNYRLTLDRELEDKLDYIKDKLENSKRQLQLLAPRARLDRYKDNLKHLKEKLDNVIDNKTVEVKNKIEKYIEMLKNRDVLDKLSKGLAYVTDDKGKKLKSVKGVKKDSILLSRLKDGTIKSKVIDIKAISLKGNSKI